MKFNFYDEMFYWLYKGFSKIGRNDDDKRFNGILSTFFVIIVLESFLFISIAVEIEMYLNIFTGKIYVPVVIFIITCLGNLLYFLKIKGRDNIVNYFDKSNKKSILRFFIILILLIASLVLWMPNSRERYLERLEEEQEKVLTNNIKDKQKIEKKYQRTSKTRFIAIKENKMWKFAEDYNKGRADVLFVLLKDRSLPYKYMALSRQMSYGRIYEIDGDYENIVKGDKANLEKVPKDKILGYWEFNYTNIDRILFHPNPDYKSNNQ